ncbi:MAG: phosphoribosylaminoimidazolesuccinocarboxamide synthase [Candidatus Bathyarchaeota archaeon]|nr:phosphoribosylaminoimidazolesuccinocarboxamide synthase [Candidatus Bathyarchaeota archaeon]
MGSVKDLEIVSNASEQAMGIARFHFSDRYSVFDWGEMPDKIKGKGEALCLMGAYCFEQLEAKEIKTHYRGLVNRNGKTVTLKEIDYPTSIMAVNLVNVYPPKTRKNNNKLEYDYSQYAKKPVNCLIPLEIIYRNGLPESSSVFKRLKQGKTTLKDLGLDHYPVPGEHFSRPIFDVSTKLEDKDRYLTWENAKRISGLTDKELAAVKSVLLEVNSTITKIVADAGLVNEDGKIELGFDEERRLMIVDVVGTLDECRFMYDGMHVSKEILRKFYKKTKWYNAVEEAKKITEKQNTHNWKEICKLKPPKLDSKLINIVSGMYMATTNEVIKRKFFDVDPLNQIIENYKKYLEKQK